jgi:diguanylate cyclase (GGDEF)-like protein
MKALRAALFEDAPADRRTLAAALKKAGLKLGAARTAEELSAERVIVLGPRVKSAAQLARAAKARAPGSILLSAQKSLTKPAWADGVLPLPVSARDLAVRLPELLELRDGASQRVSLRPGEGILDPLTGFYTFTHFKEVLFIEVKRARRYGFPLSAALITADPLARDLTDDLRSRLFGGLALAIRRSLRDTDYPVQYSPDRVLLLMPHTDLAGALVVTRRICDRVAHATLVEGEHILRPTVSAGVAASVGTGGSFSFADLARHAQESLELAIQRGGNRVEFFDTAASGGSA